MTAMKVGPVCLLKMTFCFNRVLLVYIFLELLHFLGQGYDFQTWELSSKFVLGKSGLYFITLVPSSSSRTAVGVLRQSAFLILVFLTRCEMSFDSEQCSLPFVSSWQQSAFVEAMFHRTIVDKINAGMWSTSTC